MKDLLVVATLFVGVAFAGASVVHALDRPANDNAPTSALCQPANDTNTVNVSAEDAPTSGAADELHC